MSLTFGQAVEIAEAGLQRAKQIADPLRREIVEFELLMALSGRTVYDSHPDASITAQVILDASTVDGVIDGDKVKQGIVSSLMIAEDKNEKLLSAWDVLLAKDQEFEKRNRAALERIMQSGGVDGKHHKAWVLDQVVRCLTGCPTVQREATDPRGDKYTYTALGENEDYLRFVRDCKDGEDGPESYEYDEGIAP
jgi:hypothetical protein